MNCVGKQVLFFKMALRPGIFYTTSSVGSGVHGEVRKFTAPHSVLIQASVSGLPYCLVYIKYIRKSTSVKRLADGSWNQRLTGCPDFWALL